jgi:tetrapyrrole methylase family protein/MazG family protein/ATP diphosphatase
MAHKQTLNKVDSLLKIMQALRAPNGCPWDAEQTPESLTPFILEEACELIDAIEDGSTELVLDELGDLLLQVVFQAQIFEERKQFDFHDVAAGIADKLVRRHPHVFSHDDSAAQAGELDKQWDEIKRSESTNNKTCLADHLPRKLPALQRAQKLVNRVYRAGRQSELPAEQQQLLRGIRQTQSEKGLLLLDEESLGQLLFCLTRLAHDANLDAETALRKTTRRIIEDLDQD